MFNCPKCKISLIKKSSDFGYFWVCPTCSGKVISLSYLRKSVPDFIVNEFWRRIKSEEYPRNRRCPACKTPMSEVPVLEKEKAVYLDVCNKCYFVWFDANEFESLPKVEIPEQKLKELPDEARALLAKYEIERMAEERKKEEKAEAMSTYDIIFRFILLVVFKII